MARPFKETPILYGEDARRFQEAMDNIKPYPPEKMKELRNRYNEFCNKLEHNCFGVSNERRAAN